MVSAFITLFILFFVIFDPLASMAVFLAATKSFDPDKQKKVAIYAVAVAAGLSLLVLLFGDKLLQVFNTNINDFKVAGGIILGILGVKMALGHSVAETEKAEADSSLAIASLIGTPLLTGPAAITAIIVATEESGMLLTGSAVFSVLLLSFGFLYFANKITNIIGKTGIHVLSTILGLITLSWGIMFIRAGLGIWILFA